MQDTLTLWETIWKSPSQIENCLFNLINLIKLNHLNSPHARHVNAVGDHLKKPQSNWKLPFQFDQIEPFEQPSCKSVYHCGRPFEKTGVKLKNALSIWSIWSNWTIWTALMQDTLTLWETSWKSPSQIENCLFNLINLIKLNHLNSPHARHVNAVGDHLKKPESNWKLLFQFDQFDQIEPFEQPSRKTRSRCGRPFEKASVKLKIAVSIWSIWSNWTIWTALMQERLSLWETIWKDRSQIEKCPFNLINLIKLNHFNSPHARHVNTVGDHLKKPESNWKLLFQFDQIEPFEQPSRKSVYHCGRPFEKTGVKLKNALSIWSIWSNWTISTALTQDTFTLWETIWKDPSQIENCLFNLINLIKLNHLNSPHARAFITVGDHLKRPESNWKFPFQFDQIEPFEQPSRKTR